MYILYRYIDIDIALLKQLVSRRLSSVAHLIIITFEIYNSILVYVHNYCLNRSYYVNIPQNTLMYLGILILAEYY